MDSVCRWQGRGVARRDGVVPGDRGPDRPDGAVFADLAAGRLRIDIDATPTVDHSDNKQSAAATWKKTFGHRPLSAFLDRSEIADSEPPAGLLRPGNAGSMASLSTACRPDAAGAPTIVVRSDSVRATKAFAAHCRARGVEFSFGSAVNARCAPRPKPSPSPRPGAWRKPHGRRPSARPAPAVRLGNRSRPNRSAKDGTTRG